MKKILVATVLSTMALTATANPWSDVLLGAIGASVLIASIQNEAQAKQRAIDDAAQPALIYVYPKPGQPAQYHQYPGRPSVQYQYPTQPSAPVEDSRTTYIKECQRYGFTMDKCILMWDGSTIQQPSVVTR